MSNINGQPCDQCGEPIQPGDLIYTVARPGPRHARCNDALRERASADVKASIARIKRLVRDLRG